MSETLPLQEVSLSEIKELDEEYWYDDREKSSPTCRSITEHLKLINDVDLDYPVILCAEGRVMDGMHRICRALIEGRETVIAKKFGKTPEPHFIDVDLDDLPYDD